MNPYKILNAAIKAVPALRYALAVAGIGAVVSIILGFVKDPKIAVFGILITIGLMFILVIFSHAVKDIPGVRWLAAILAWAMTLLFIASLMSVFTAFAFSFPQTLASYFRKDEQQPSNAQVIRPEVNKYSPVQVMFQGNRENSGSVFEDLKTGKRKRFGNQDTKHNDTCWVGRWSYSVCVAFVDVHIWLPGVLLDRIHVKKATFLISEFTKVEGNEITRWLGPLMVFSLDYNELDVSDVDNIFEKGQKIRSYENIYDLSKPTDITTKIQNLFEKRQEHFRLVFIFPSRGEDQESPGKIHFEPNKVQVFLEYQEIK